MSGKTHRLEIQGCPESAGMITNSRLLANSNIRTRLHNNKKTSVNKMMKDFNIQGKVLSITAKKEYRVKKN